MSTALNTEQTNVPPGSLHPVVGHHGLTIMKYRKKPVIIEAEQWLGPQSSPMRGVFCEGDTNNPDNYWVVTIHEQRCYLKPGDWILPEPDGVHFYPCKPDIFAATYEPVSE